MKLGENQSNQPNFKFTQLASTELEFCRGRVISGLCSKILSHHTSSLPQEYQPEIKSLNNLSMRKPPSLSLQSTPSIKWGLDSILNILQAFWSQGRIVYSPLFASTFCPLVEVLQKLWHSSSYIRESELATTIQDHPSEN